ncbi:MAG TPA: type II toxin-antitoxin system VapC family toxin [Stellaceae bacterium]|nr:type II toxin-antitoxin system VapC family toxin [Stellaceae bacterium]
MIAIDTSALYAILTNEPEASSFLRAISSDDAPAISALTLYETMIVCHARGRDPLLDDLRQLMLAGNIKTVAFDGQAAEAAHAAYRRFGKGYHPAGLNLTDCAAYSLAATLGCPLLCKGDDFTKTGIAAAVQVTPGSPGSSVPSGPNP